MLSDDEREWLDKRDRWGDIKQGYYIGFEATGVPEIDRILAAIGYAGKAFHSTEAWTDDLEVDYGPIKKGNTCSQLIQAAANDAAQRLRDA